jgi:hypothetical protein
MVILLHSMFLCVVIGVSWAITLERVSKTFVKKGWLFRRDETVLAIQDMSLNVPDTETYTSFVGSSGAGKSTLCELICGVQEPTSGNIERSSSFSVGEVITPHYYMTYDRFRSVKEVLSAESSYTAQRDPIVVRAMEILRLPSTSPVESLLVSERRSFDILLALHRIIDHRNEGKFETVIAEDECKGPLICLDEYLDKDLTSVRETVCKSLRSLSSDSVVRLRTIVATHSKNVMSEADYVVALKGGVLYSKGAPDVVTLPTQLEMIP